MSRGNARAGFVMLAYLMLPIVNAVTPLVVLPALTSQHGAPVLAAYGIALSVGSAASLLAELGWGIVGPQHVARSDAAERHQYLEHSLASKMVTIGVAGPTAAIVTYFLAQDFQLDAAIMAFGFALGCLSSTWYFIGLNQPGKALLLEGIPRLVFFAGSAIAVALGGPVILFALATVCAPVMTYVLTCKITRQRLLPRRDSVARGLAVARSQAPLTLGRGVSALYTALPTTLVALVAPSSVAMFTAVERLMRMAAGVLIAFHNRLQNWVGSANDVERLRRLVIQTWASAGLAIVSVTAFALLAPPVSKFVFSGSADVPLQLALYSGLVLGLIIMNRSCGLSLVAIGKANWIAAANFAAAPVGLVSILLLGSMYGAYGGALGEVLAELVAVVTQAGLVLWFIRRSRQPRTGDE